jgi:hypothetical protein
MEDHWWVVSVSAIQFYTEWTWPLRQMSFLRGIGFCRAMPAEADNPFGVLSGME